MGHFYVPPFVKNKSNVAFSLYSWHGKRWCQHRSQMCKIHHSDTWPQVEQESYSNNMTHKRTTTKSIKLGKQHLMNTRAAFQM